MAVDAVPLCARWQYYLDRSRDTDARRIDDFGHGRDEQLREMLDIIAAGVPFDATTRARLDRLPWNRAKKHRRLRRRLSARAGSGRPTPERADAVAVADEIAGVYRVLNPDQWHVEVRLASGETLAAVAARCGVSAGTLKMRIGRWRARVRRRMTDA